MVLWCPARAAILFREFYGSEGFRGWCTIFVRVFQCRMSALAGRGRLYREIVWARLAVRME